jgi:hypothetical protein
MIFSILEVEKITSQLAFTQSILYYRKWLVKISLLSDQVLTITIKPIFFCLFSSFLLGFSLYPSYQPTFPGTCKKIMFAVIEYKNMSHEKQTRDVSTGSAVV